jgi:TonB family protein
MLKQNWQIKAGVVGVHLLLIWALTLINTQPIYLPIKPNPVFAVLLSDSLAQAKASDTKKIPKVDMPDRNLQAFQIQDLAKVQASNLRSDTAEMLSLNNSSNDFEKTSLSTAAHKQNSLEKTIAIELPSTDADYFKNPPPQYPRMSKRLGEQGVVIVRALIGVSGQAEKAEIYKSSGYERLDQAALDAVIHWRYVPGKRLGRVESMWFNIPVKFELN